MSSRNRLRDEQPETEAINPADPLLLTIPNQLGIDYDHPQVRRSGLGWR